MNQFAEGVRYYDLEGQTLLELPEDPRTPFSPNQFRLIVSRLHDRESFEAIRFSFNHLLTATVEHPTSAVMEFLSAQPGYSLQGYDEQSNSYVPTVYSGHPPELTAGDSQYQALCGPSGFMLKVDELPEQGATFLDTPDNSFSYYGREDKTAVFRDAAALYEKLIDYLCAGEIPALFEEPIKVRFPGRSRS